MYHQGLDLFIHVYSCTVEKSSQEWSRMLKYLKKMELLGRCFVLVLNSASAAVHIHDSIAGYQRQDLSDMESRPEGAKG